MMRWTLALAVIGLAMGCGPQDEDGDGFAGELDCDEGAVDVFPGANEACDGIDNDCDGEVDEDGAEGALVWFVDADGDGFGSPAGTRMACAQPEGFVATLGDCDDADGSVYPAAPELCDEIDNDCNYLVDDEPDEGEGAVFHPDRDGDGFGAENVSIRSCNPIDRYVRSDLASDCDDFNVYVNVDAVERCDYIDNNCDRFVDEGTAVDAITWYADTDADGFGDVAVPLDACYQPEGYVLDTTDCDDSTDLVNPSLDEICNDGVDQNCNGLPDQCSPVGWAGEAEDTANVEIGLDSGEAYGDSGISLLDDLDGDGLMEVAFTDYFAESACTFSPTSTSTGFSCGMAVVFPGDAFGAEVDSLDQSSDALFTIEGDHAYDYYGEDPLVTGDFDGDGNMDMAFAGDGADRYSGSSTLNSSIGAVAVVYGDGTGPAGQLMTDDGARVYGANTSDFFGEGLYSPGDLDGDGYDDLIVGSDGYDASGISGSGKLTILYGGATRWTDGATTTGFPGWIGHRSFDSLGDAFDANETITAGDYNGDGNVDVAFSNDNYDGVSGTTTWAGGVFVFYGDGTRVSGDENCSNADAIGEGSGSFTYYGQAMTDLGDLDDDGYDDLGVVDGNGVDYLRIFKGSATDWADVDPGNADISIAGTSGTMSYGGAMTGDFSGAGIRSLVLGEPNADPNNTWSAGIVYVFLDASTLSGDYDVAEADVQITGSSQYTYFGQNFDVGDLNGDGIDDLVTGTYGSDVGWVFYGAGI